jgi:cytochrome c-type biogenesis protein CcmH
MLTRREFFVAAAGTGLALGARALDGQQPSFTPMDQNAYRPVIRPAKPDATPSMTPDERDKLERELKCQCTCILDVYTCRTTDFTCGVSPAMHRDVMRLVAGGYDAQEIKDAFVETYGEVALTAPIKQGFNWAGYFVPSVVMATGGVILTMMIRRWTSKATPAVAAASPSAAPAAPNASDDEMARLEAALREDA